MVSQNVGIFSRDGESCYSWLVTYLLTFLALGDVHPVYITNNNYHSVRENISLCNFAILYHTKRRGRVNITDVTDSLYEDELNMLSRSLGKENVIVVIDDLDDSGSVVKETILQNQPSIRRLTQDLFLFSVQDKQYINVDNHGVMTDKLNPIKLLIKKTAGWEETHIVIQGYQESKIREKLWEPKIQEKLWCGLNRIVVALILFFIVVMILIILMWKV
ncbi:uncharacterized protein LOC128643529 isoform X1 [Bombina bombina]|uniref:uncharacterized protein LOC128643529 isoform X1 n=1 Tax=Bombina bombina TaxID=8345 RepID=UPI00235A97FD|nr:uncharacterized protein LOC128643529 isoform X1 [Bombina bombina]